MEPGFLHRRYAKMMLPMLEDNFNSIINIIVLIITILKFDDNGLLPFYWQSITKRTQNMNYNIQIATIKENKNFNLHVSIMLYDNFDEKNVFNYFERENFYFYVTKETKLEDFFNTTVHNTLLEACKTIMIPKSLISKNY